jgi:tRNA (pseudouridine54-N1)-methyltransferase
LKGITYKSKLSLLCPMREFILVARKAHTTEFNIDNLPAAGRMDIVASFVANCLWVSNNLRSDTIVRCVLEGPRTPPMIVSFIGSELKGFAYDNKGIAEMINQALKAARTDREVRPSAGITVCHSSFEALIADKKNLYYLHEKGEDIRTAKIPEDASFIIGDYIGIDPKREKLIERRGAERISLGKTMLLAAQCPVIINYELDRNRI